MNKLISLVKSALVFGALVIAVNASTIEAETLYLKSFNGRVDIPVPVKVETPFIGRVYAGSVIDVSFVVNTFGKVESLEVISDVSVETKTDIATALAKWEFKPLFKNGSTVKTTVKLPITVAALK
jgi:hypothetical protein